MPTKTRPSPWQLVIIANDFQVPFHDPKALILLELFLKRERPEWLILAGDFQDFWEISSFDTAPHSGKRLLQEIELGTNILKGFRRTLPQARITWLEGNHEFRLRRYLMKHARELYDLPALTVPELFGLKDLRIEYVACDQRASKFTGTHVQVGNLYVGHFEIVAKHGGYAAKQLVEDKGVSLLQSHTHRFGAHARTGLDGRLVLGVENFSMCSRRQSYTTNPNWQQGFSAVYLEPSSGRFQWYPILLDGYRFVWKEREYSLAGVNKVRIKQPAK